MENPPKSIIKLGFCKDIRQRINSALLDFFKHAWLSGSRKKYDIVKEIGPLNRVFGTADAAFMSMATCLSFFFYTTVVEEIRRFGPVMSLAFFIASIMTTFTVLSHAELMAKAPVMGSTYHYSYRYVGEFIGFIVGWSGIFNLFNRCSLMINGCSELLDVLFFDKAISKLEETHLSLPKHIPLLRPFADVIALLISIAFSGIVAAKPKESKIANNLVTILNVCALSTMMILMSGQASVRKLGLDPQIKFALKGPMSIFPAVTMAISYFNGIECIALLGDEVKEPHTAMPKSILYSLITCYIYFIGLTLLFSMVMSYDDDTINTWVTLLIKLNLSEVAWIPKLGAICAIYGGTFTHLFWLTRLLHAMGRDGLLFHVLSKIAHTSGVPVATAFIAGLCTGVYTAFFRTDDMLNTEVFTALIMHAMASTCLLISRYSDGSGGEEAYVGHRLIFINHPQVDNPTELTEQVSSILITVIIVTLALMSHIGMRFIDEKENTNLAKTLFILVVIIFSAAFYCLYRQPQHKSEYYQIHCVPLIPCINILLIFIVEEYLFYEVWKFFLVYFSIGTIFYFSYSMNNSNEDYAYGRGKWYVLNNRTRLPQPKEYKGEIQHTLAVAIPKRTIFWHRPRY